MANTELSGFVGYWLPKVESELRELLTRDDPAVAEHYQMMCYHFGWVDEHLRPAFTPAGKRLRPLLCLLACAEVGGDPLQAMPAAVAIELLHNFSLIHDDIEDGDEQRRHRPTLWKLWGVPQAINSGDGLFSLARLGLWRLAERGVDPRVVIGLADLLDRTCLALCEGQFLDMHYEGRRDVSVAMYLAMIERKTAALMACAMEVGARLGASEDAALASTLARCGRALGMAFQLRDDLLGIWSADALGKTPAGDLRRKKMTLPILHALEHAQRADRDVLIAIYDTAGPAPEAEIVVALAALERSGARERVRAALGDAATTARAALAEAAGEAPRARAAAAQLAALVEFVVSSAGS